MNRVVGREYTIGESRIWWLVYIFTTLIPICYITKDPVLASEQSR